MVGKTTAMLTLAGAIAPAQGEVRRPGPAAFVFQNPRLQTATMTVREELAFGPRILAWPENEIGAFVDAGLEWTGLITIFSTPWQPCLGADTSSR